MTLPLSLLVAHFIGDFLLQSDWMALNKSRRWDALTLHAFVYASCFFWVEGVWFMPITFVTHFITDAITSRITSKLWFIRIIEPRGSLQTGEMAFYGALDQGEKRHWFFVIIGLDQLIHYITLAWTLRLLQS